MGFVTGYEKLQAAFDGGQAKEATLGDVFRPNVSMPDLAVPIGIKLERSERLMLPGGLAVAVTCRIVKPDSGMCEGVVDMAHFSTTYEPVDMATKQIAEWQENGRRHHARFVGGLSGRLAVNADDGWRVYRHQLEAQLPEDEVGLPPQSSVQTIYSEVTTPDGQRWGGPDLYRRHFGVLRETDGTLPGVLGMPADEGVFGAAVYKPQTPEQFEQRVDWLLAGQA
jgi:hypothetical protein